MLKMLGRIKLGGSRKNEKLKKNLEENCVTKPIFSLFRLASKIGMYMN